MTGRLRIRRDGAACGSVNMARDAALLAGHRPGDDPVLRLYRWDPPAVTIGYNQDLRAFDAKALRAAGYDLVRRPTGGRAILHADELTYAVVGSSPGPLFGRSLHDSYLSINRALTAFLADLGLQAEVLAGESLAQARGVSCFRSAGRHEIRVGGRKIIGSAQRRQRGVFLQHGSILTGPGHRDLPRFLKGSDHGATGGEVQPQPEVTTDLSQALCAALDGPALEALADRLAAACCRVWGLEPLPDP